MVELVVGLAGRMSHISVRDRVSVGQINLNGNKKIDETSVTSESSKTFVITHEDHTLGNALRHILAQDHDTQFCGYSIPHPSEPKMHLRLQTNGGKPSTEVLEAGLENLSSICDHILTCADEALERDC